MRRLLFIAVLLFFSATHLIIFTVTTTEISIFMLSLLVLIPLFVADTISSKKLILPAHFCILFLYFLLSFLLNFSSTKPTSIIYSFIFLIFYLSSFRYLEYLKKQDFILIFKCIIIMYFANVLITQLLISSSYHIPPLSDFFQALYDKKTGSMRYYGFSSEPSYAAFIVIISLWALIELSKNEVRKPNFTAYFLITAYQVYYFRSIFGYSLLVMVAFYHYFPYIKKNLFAFSVPVVVFGLVAALQAREKNLDRFKKIYDFFLEGEWSLDTLVRIDSSAYMRVAPFIEYVKHASIFDYHFFVGYGAATSAKFFGNLFYFAIGTDNQGYQTQTLLMGFLPAFLYDFGIIGVIVVVLTLFRKSIHTIFTPGIAFLILVLFNANFNTQLFWFVIFVNLIVSHTKNEFDPETSRYPAIR